MEEISLNNNFIVEEVPRKKKIGEDHKIVRVVDGDQASIGLYGIVDSKNNFITKPNNMLIAIKKQLHLSCRHRLS